MITLRVLGGFALEGPPDAPLGRLPQQRAEAALAVLAVAGDLGCTRDRLIGLLWPESDGAHARHNLRDTLYAIRHSLGPGVILASGEFLRLNPTVITSDVQALVHALEATPLANALAWYRGPLLDGFHVDGAPEFEHWVDSERSRLNREYGEALERLATSAESAGSWAEAASWWTRAVEHDPHSTRVVIRLMRALAAAGDRANALKEAGAHARRLRAELEVEPDAELAVEMERIRSGNAGAGPLRMPAPPVPTGGSTGLLAGPALGVVAAPGDGDLRSATQRKRYRRLWRRAALVAAAGVCVAGAAAAWRWGRRAPAALDLDLVAVLPFSASPDKPSLLTEASHLQGIVTRDLLGGPAPQAVEPAVVRGAWERTAGTGDRSRDPREVEARVARATRAGLVLRGSLDSTAGGRVLTLTLVELPRRVVLARRSLESNPSSLEAAAHRLVLEVLALEAGQPAHRLPELLGHRREVVRRFLSGARRFDLSRTCRGWLTDVWRADSSLVYPGFDCLHVAGLWPYSGRDPWYDSVAVNVWRHRAALVREDQAYADALVGPWFGLADDAEARIALWQVAANAAPGWWLPGTHLGFMLADFGPLTSIPDWRVRARDALSRALAAGGWSRLPTLGTAIWFAIFDGDSALARQALEATERRARRHGAGWTHARGGWWTGPRDWPPAVDAAFGSGALAARWFNPADDRNDLVSRYMFALSLAVPRTMRFADAMAARLEHAVADTGTTVSDWWIGFHWRARGRYDAWIRYRYRGLVYRWRQAYALIDNTAMDAGFLSKAIYLGAPQDTIVASIVDRMRRIVAGDSSPPPTRGVTGIAHCWLAQWRLARGDTTGVARAIAYLRDLDARDRAGQLDGLPSRGRWEVCPALLEAQAARIAGRDALGRAQAMDRLLRRMPVPRRGYSDAFDGSATHDQTRSFLENQLAAQLLAAAGDTAGALAAIRRRPWDLVMLDFFLNVNEYDRLEGRFAAALADTIGAVAAYEHYLALRTERPAHPPWAAQWDSVRAELAALRPRS